MIAGERLSGSMSAARNDPCPCGSRRRYKNCCGALTTHAPTAIPQTLELERLSDLLDGERYAELESAVEAMLAQQRDSRSQPQSAVLWQLLAVGRTRQGKDALSAWRMAVQCAPEDSIAQLNLANGLARLGRHEEAAASYRHALAADPEFAEAHNNLGELLLTLQRPEEARAALREALRIRPEFAAAHHNLGRALSGLARFEEAVPSFARALELDPGVAEAHANLAHALRAIGRLDEAVAAYRRALLIAPGLLQAHTELATALRLQRRGQEAEECCREALAIDADCAAAVLVLAELRADAGRFSEAEQLFRRVLSIDPALPEAWAGLARVRRLTPADQPWLEATQRLVGEGVAPQQELLLRYAIGKYCDDVGDFEQAFRNYKLANELAKGCGPPHDRSALSRTIDLIIRSQEVAWIGRRRDAAPQSARPVFIVGMLRSGTTLAEQILASHPDVFGAGELTFWSGITAAAVSGVSAADGAALRFSDAAVADQGNRYLRLLEPQAGDAQRVVDKLPTNFLSLGSIHAALPRARIIHLVRHPMDTCLSIYFQHFEAANTYTHDLGDLAHYYREYHRLMQHWRAVLPAGSMLSVPYEGLVEDLPGWTRRMLEFIGVPWDSRCLDFHLTERAVVTASKWQVRQQLFASPVGRWRRYQPFLSQLTPLLELAPHQAAEAGLSSPP